MNYYQVYKEVILYLPYLKARQLLKSESNYDQYLFFKRIFPNHKYRPSINYLNVMDVIISTLIVEDKEEILSNLINHDDDYEVDEIKDLLKDINIDKFRKIELGDLTLKIQTIYKHYNNTISSIIKNTAINSIKKLECLHYKIISINLDKNELIVTDNESVGLLSRRRKLGHRYSF